MLGKIEGKRRREWQRRRWLECITNSTDMNLSKLWERVKDRGIWHANVHGVVKSQTWLSNWETTMSSLFLKEIDYIFQVSHQEISLQHLCCYWQIMCSWGIAIPSIHVGLSIHSFIHSIVFSEDYYSMCLRFCWIQRLCSGSGWKQLGSWLFCFFVLCGQL